MSADINLADNPWESAINMNSMTDSLIKKGDPKPKKDDQEKKAQAEAQKAAEAEKKAIQDARAELLTPEKVDSTALQTDASIKQRDNSDLESEKMAEIMEDNKEFAQTSESSTSTKKSSSERASISGQLRVSSNEVEDIINAPIDKVENVLEKEDAPKGGESDDKQS